MKTTHETHFATLAIHAGYDAKQHQGALTPPIHVSSTYAFDTVEQGGAAFQGENDRFIYARLGSPSQQILEQRLAQLEQADAALATASGMEITGRFSMFLNTQFTSFCPLTTGGSSIDTIDAASSDIAG